MVTFKKFSKFVKAGTINEIMVGSTLFKFNSISELAKQAIQLDDGIYTVGALFSQPLFHSPKKDGKEFTKSKRI